MKASTREKFTLSKEEQKKQEKLISEEELQRRKSQSNKDKKKNRSENAKLREKRYQKKHVDSQIEDFLAGRTDKDIIKCNGATARVVQKLYNIKLKKIKLVDRSSFICKYQIIPNYVSNVNEE